MYSDTFPDWNGRYTQEGVQIFMHGDYAKDVDHNGMALEIVTGSEDNLATAHWKKWRDDDAYGNTIEFANATLIQAGKCEVLPPGGIADINVAPRYLLDGRIAQNPGDKGQVPLESLQSK